MRLVQCDVLSPETKKPYLRPLQVQLVNESKKWLKTHGSLHKNKHLLTKYGISSVR